MDAAELVDYSVRGYYISSHSCSDYKKLYKIVDSSAPGLVILAEDGSYCAIVDKEGDKFVHVHPKTGMVTLTPLVRIGEFFKTYAFKSYDC